MGMAELVIGPAGGRTCWPHPSYKLRDSHRSETHPNAPTCLPNDPARFPDPAVVENEFQRNGVAAVHVDAGAARAEIDNVADGRPAFQIDKQDSGLGDQSRGPDTMESSMLSHFALSQRVFPAAILTAGFIRAQCCAAPYRGFKKHTINLSFIWPLQI